MAEGFLRALAGDRLEVASAGTKATRVHPLAVRAMAEVGIDIGAYASKTLDQFLGQPWDYVITVCDSANERCPVFPARTTRIHWSFDDPSRAWHGRRPPADLPAGERPDRRQAPRLACLRAVSHSPRIYPPVIVA